MANEKRGKKLSLLVCVGMLCIALVGGTFAYLTDRDATANVFTQGNVDITLNEDFIQGSELLPGVDVEKSVSVTNNDRTSAYAWVEIAVPAALDSEKAYENILHFNYSAESVEEGKWTWEDSEGWMVEEEEIDGAKYNVYTVMYQTPLASGETTPSAMTKVYLDPHVDVAPDGTLNWVEDGVATPTVWNVNDDTIIYVSAYAIQAEGFESVQDAYAAYQTQWGENGKEWGEPVEVVSTQDALNAALKAGDDVVLDSGEFVLSLANSEGATVTGTNGTVVVPAEGSDRALTGTVAKDVTVQNITFSGYNAARYTYTSGDVTFEDCVFDGEVYGYHVDGANNGTITFNNCTFVGFNAFAATGTYYFNNCTFLHSGSYGWINMWGTGYFQDCTFGDEVGYDECGANGAIYINGERQS